MTNWIRRSELPREDNAGHGYSSPLGDLDRRGATAGGERRLESPTVAAVLLAAYLLGPRGNTMVCQVRQRSNGIEILAYPGVSVAIVK
jgi:hypothetical protein